MDDSGNNNRVPSPGLAALFFPPEPARPQGEPGDRDWSVAWRELLEDTPILMGVLADHAETHEEAA